MRTGGDKTRKRLIHDALKLFTVLPYDKVTFNVLERATGLSRGAILYHVENKEQLFREVADVFIFQNSTLAILKASEQPTLRGTIETFVDKCAEEQKYWAENGIPNINFARTTILMSAFSVFQDSIKASADQYARICEIWRKSVSKAVTSGEIRDVDSILFGRIFANLYLGCSNSALTRNNGYDVEQLRRQMLGVYDSIANIR